MIYIVINKKLRGIYLESIQEKSSTNICRNNTDINGDNLFVTIILRNIATCFKNIDHFFVHCNLALESIDSIVIVYSDPDLSSYVD